MTLTIRNFESAINKGGNILQGSSQDTLKATGKGFKGKIVKWFSSTSKKKNRAVMKSLVNAVKNQYGEETGTMAKTLLKGLDYTGKPLTSRIARDVLTAIRMETVKIKEHNNDLAERFIANREPQNDNSLNTIFSSVAQQIEFTEEVKLSDINLQNLKLDILNAIDPLSNDHKSALSMDTLIEGAKQVINKNLQTKKIFLDSLNELNLETDHNTIIKSMILKSELITNNQQLDVAVDLLTNSQNKLTSNFQEALDSCKRNEMTATDIFTIFHNLRENYMPALANINMDSDISTESFSSMIFEIALKTGNFSDEDKQDIFNNINSDNAKEVHNSMMFLGSLDSKNVEYISHLMLPVFLKKEMCFSLMRGLEIPYSEMPENVAGISDYEYLDQVDPEMIEVSEQIKKDLGIKSEKLL